MTKLFNYISLFFLAGLLVGCSQVLQTVDLNINSDDPSMQEEFNVVEKTLTIREAKAQKSSPYIRTILKNGRGENAQPIAEELAYQAITRAMSLIERLHNGTSLKELSEEKSPLQTYQTIHREKYHSASHQLRPGLVNFLPISKGERLHAEGSPQLLAPIDGLLLFPKYPLRRDGVLAEAIPKEIYRIIQPI